MFEFHGFDPKTLTNEQLMEKQLALTTRKLMAARFGKVDAVNQLQMMITAIELEYRERLYTERIGSVMLAQPSVVLETDAELQEPVVEAKPVKHEDHQRSVRRAVRTSKPVTP